MMPTLTGPLRALTGATLLLAIGAAGGWAVNGWRLGAELAEAKAAQSDQNAAQARAALSAIQTDAQAINKAAGDLLAMQRALAPKFEQLQKAVKDAKPLPSDCRPDDFRVRALDAGIDAANAPDTGH